MARTLFDKSKSKVLRVSSGRTERMLKRFNTVNTNTVTVAAGAPRGSDGKVGDITIRSLSDGSYRAFVKLESGWYDINTMVASNKIKWYTMALGNSWVKESVNVATPAFFKDSHGIVHLRGAVDSGSSATATIATLPTGFRPATDQYRLILDNNMASPAVGDLSILKITTAGVVNLSNSGNTTGASLDGVTFFADQEVQTIHSQHGSSSRGSVDATINSPIL